MLKVGDGEISSRAEREKNFLTATILKVHICGPLHLYGRFYLYEALSLLYGLFTPV